MSNVVAAIDFGTNKIACIIAQENAYGSIEILGSGMCLYTGLKDGRFDEQELEEALYSAVREAEIHARRKVRDIYVAIPNEMVAVMTSKTHAEIMGAGGRVSEEDISELMAAASEVYMPDRYWVLHRSPLYYVLDKSRRVIEPLGLKGSYLEGMFAFSLADILCLEQIEEVMGRLDMRVERFVYGALAEALMLPDQIRDRVALMMDVGYTSTQVSLVEGDGIIFSETLPFGGYDITAEIADAFQITFEEAEQIKRKFVFEVNAREEDRREITFTQASGRLRRLSVQDVARVIEVKVERLCHEAHRTVMTSGYRLGSRNPVYLSGGGIAMMRGVQPFVAVSMGRPVHVLAPSDPAINTPTYYTAYCILEWAFRLHRKDEPAGILATLYNWLKGFFG